MHFDSGRHPRVNQAFGVAVSLPLPLPTIGLLLTIGGLLLPPMRTISG
jgi:hypothetical protein